MQIKREELEKKLDEIREAAHKARAWADTASEMIGSLESWLDKEQIKQTK